MTSPPASPRRPRVQPALALTAVLAAALLAPAPGLYAQDGGQGSSDPAGPQPLYVSEEPSGQAGGSEAPAPQSPETFRRPQPGQDSQVSERESHDLNTIATLSVGLTLQAFGYIGAYGDLFSSGAYESEQVINMLGDAVRYLANAHRELARYQDPDFSLTPGDRRYLAEVASIIELLIQEAESLRLFAQSRDDGDLQKFRRARDNAWKRLDRLIKQ
jgi:hypothetical protein